MRMLERRPPFRYKKGELVLARGYGGEFSRPLRVAKRESVPSSLVAGAPRGTRVNEYRLVDPDAKPKLFAKAGLIPVIGRRTIDELQEKDIAPFPYDF